MLPIEDVIGLDFSHPETADIYGTIRQLTEDPASHPASQLNCLPLAEDGCGNAFVQTEGDKIAFWDHETDELIPLAANWNAFVGCCDEPSPVELDESKVKSVWIDPDFAKEMGIDVPPDGLKKKS